MHAYRTVFLILVSTIAVLLAASSFAQDKPSMSAARTLTMSATVEAIDHATRHVTLKGPEGRDRELYRQR